MNKKKSALVIILSFFMIILLATFIIAQSEEYEEDPIELSYSCLEERLGDNCGDSRNIEEISFNLLAMSYDSSIQSDCVLSLIDKGSENCWGDKESASCNIRNTALAIMALDYVGEDVDNYVNWLLDRKKQETDLTWFLEIDANNKTECNINGKNFVINSNKKITGSNPSGLSKTFNNYWFEIRDVKRDYVVSCDRDFLVSLLYQKPGSNVFYVPGKTDSAPAHDSITTKVESYCFSTSSKCDYVGSLWAALALSRFEEDIYYYLPYISAMYDEPSNKKYIPSAFLYMLTGEDDYSSELLELQKQNKYWDEGNNKLYDTSLALLALEDFSDSTITAKEYLLSVRETSGCWSSNTPFILYAGWPKIPYTSSSGTTASDCESFNYYCVPRAECSSDKTLENFWCSALSDICCETQPQEEFCEEKGGQICSEDKECSQAEVVAADTVSCCLGSCIEISEENECEDMGYICRDECSDSEEEQFSYSDSCDAESFGQICCSQKASKGTNWLLIILLIVLIVLVILAIIFRNQLKVLWFKTKNKFKPGKPPSSTSRFSPPPFSRQVRPRPFARPPINRRPPVRSSRRSKSSRDKDFDETMRKLRDMSK